jgi:hypothetical protein
LRLDRPAVARYFRPEAEAEAEAEEEARNLSFYDPFGDITTVSGFLECAHATKALRGFRLRQTRHLGGFDGPAITQSLAYLAGFTIYITLDDMDLVDTLRRKITALEDGEYLPGLKAVLLHVETAFRHLSRGQQASDDTAFTDAIYRTNQAFEGSVKEAYRVLAGKDPSKKTPYEIEDYLEKKNTFRSRVLGQLTTYRTEWRNPSTHDYKLDFDESEAFLAIVSVTAFACLLLDQISERLAFNKAQAAVDQQKTQIVENLEESMGADLQTRAAELLARFCSIPLPYHAQDVVPSESQIVGALQGFLASIAPDVTVVPEALFGKEMKYRVDLLLSRDDEQVVVEVKSSRYSGDAHELFRQMAIIFDFSGVSRGIAIVVPNAPQRMEVKVHYMPMTGGKVVVLQPTLGAHKKNSV